MTLIFTHDIKRATRRQTIAYKNRATVRRARAVLRSEMQSLPTISEFKKYDIIKEILSWLRLRISRRFSLLFLFP